MESIIIAIAAGGLALLFAALTSVRVMVQEQGNQRMRDIGDAIREGATAFLRREYLALVPFVVVVTGVLWVLIDWHTLEETVPKTAISYLAGTICSASAGLISMQVAVRANVRTAAAAMQGLTNTLPVTMT